MKTIFIVSAAFAVLFFSVFLLFSPEQPTADDELLAAGRPLPSFSLHNVDGVKVSSESFRGKVVLIFFGYGNCPDVCPTVLKKFAELESLLGNQAPSVVMVFITTDPFHDSPENLRQLVSKYSGNIVALTGSWDELAEVWAKYHVRPLEKESESGYIAHSAVIYVADRNLILRRIFTPEMPSDQMFREVVNLL